MKCILPVLAEFEGIKIEMYYMGREHNPPHIHAIYGEYSASYSLVDNKLMDGHLPNKQDKAVKTWLNKNSVVILEQWNSQNITKIG